MKFFIQRRAGVSFFLNDNLSIGIRKRYVEYVFRLSGGWYGTVNMVIDDEGVILFTSWEKVLAGLDDALPKIRFEKGQCEALLPILEGKNSDIQVLGIQDFEADGDTIVLGTRVKCNNMQHIVKIAGLPFIVDRAKQLLDTSLSVHNDLYSSGIPELRALYDNK